ncbi:MAG: hypothetical protein WCL18_04730 [bacterium]
MKNIVVIELIPICLFLVSFVSGCYFAYFWRDLQRDSVYTHDLRKSLMRAVFLAVLLCGIVTVMAVIATLSSQLGGIDIGFYLLWLFVAILMTIVFALGSTPACVMPNPFAIAGASVAWLIGSGITTGQWLPLILAMIMLCVGIGVGDYLHDRRKEVIE